MSFKRNTRITGNTICKMSTWDSSAQLWTPDELKTAPSPPTILSPTELDNATNWALSSVGIAVTANAVANPINATVDADNVYSTGGTNPKYLLQSGLSFVEGFEYTLSVYAKANPDLPNGKYVQLCFGTTCFDQDWAIFDLYNGDLVEQFGGTSPSRSSSVTDVGGGWFKYEFSLVANATGIDDVSIGFAGSSVYRITLFMGADDGAYFYNPQITCRSTLTRWLDPSDSSTLALSGSSVSTYTDKIVGEVLTSGTAPHILVANASGTASALQSTDATSNGSLSVANSNVFRNKAAGTIFWMGLITTGALVSNCSPVFVSTGASSAATRQGYNVNVNNTNTHGMGVRRLDTDGFNFLASSQTTDRDVCFIGQSTMSWQGNLGSVYYNGVQVLSPTAAPTLTGGYTSDTDSLSFGIPGTSLAPTVGSQWFDVLLFDSGLPSTIRQKLEGWIAHKASQSALLDVTHPYKTQAPYIS